MKIVIKVFAKGDDRAEEMVIDGKERLYVGPLWECPEDAVIGRDLVSCCQVADFMREAYEAGKRGDVFEVEVAE